MPKGRLQIRLTQEALKELERRAGGPDKRQAYIEAWLTGSLPARESASPSVRTFTRPDFHIDDDEPTNSLSPESKQARNEKKEARAARKAKLDADMQEFLGKAKDEFGEDVADALAGRRAVGGIVAEAFEAMGHKVIDVTPPGGVKVIERKPLERKPLERKQVVSIPKPGRTKK